MTVVGAPSTYRNWLEAEGARVVLGHYIPSLRDLELGDWKRVGGSACIINHEDSDSSNDCCVVELAAGESSVRQHHLFEETFYVLDGKGATTVWDGQGQPHSFEWAKGSLFAIPLNFSFRLFNGSGRDSARLLSVTNRPAVMNMFASPELLYECEYLFADRFGGDDAFFDGSGSFNGRIWESNFVPDVRTFELLEYKERGAGSNVKFKLARNTMWAHASEFPVGTYKKAHRHGAGAHVIILGGSGYTLMWREGEPIQRFDWREGSLVIPPDRWFHQHFNTGPEPARYLALRYSAAALHKGTKAPLTTVSTRLGGDQIEYEDESSEVREMYAAELAQNGVEMRMAGVAGFETIK